jgi:hypothetical protein
LRKVVHAGKEGPPERIWQALNDLEDPGLVAVSWRSYNLTYPAPSLKRYEMPYGSSLPEHARPARRRRLAATAFLWVRATELQHQLPGLAYQITPKAMVRHLVNEPEAHPFVDAAGGVQHVIRPQRDL